MVPVSSALGILTGWLLVILLGVCLGYGLVVAWQRWGRRAPLPDGVEKAAIRVLGPQDPHAAIGTKTTQARPDPPTDPLEVHGVTNPESPGTAMPINDPATGTQAAAPAASPQQSEPPQVQQIEQTEQAPWQNKDPDNEHEAEQDYQLTRADAIEELSLLFGIGYEHAHALVKSGLWGMENHDEWSRAMRGQTPPPGIPPELLQKVINTSPQRYQDELDKIREKRGAMKQLTGLWGVGPEEAEALYQAGFQGLEAIRASSTDKLAKVPGVGHALAFQIRASAHGLAPTV